MPSRPVAYKPYADPDDFIREVTDLIWVRPRDRPTSARTTSRTRSCTARTAPPWVGTR